jgi:hypothetical protein
MEIDNEMLGIILSFLTEKYDCRIHYIQDNKCYYNGVAIGEITYKLDGNKLDIYYVPYLEVKSINCSINILKSGANFDDI